MSRYVSFALLLGVIGVIGFLFYQVISGFLLPLFLAALLVVIFRPCHQWFVDRCGGRIRLAAVLTTAVVLTVVVAPAVLLITLAAWEIVGLGASSEGDQPEMSAEDAFKSRLSSLRASFGLELKNAPEIRYMEASLKSLRSRAAVGAVYISDKHPLENLNTALADLKEQLSDTGQADKLENLNAMIDTIDAAIKSDRVTPGSLDYQTVIAKIDQQFRAFKSKLLGGPVHIWLVGLANPTQEELGSLSDTLTSFAPGLIRSVGGATGSFLGSSLVGLAIMTISLYFFLADGPGMVNTIMHLSPLDDQYELELVEEFDRISRAVVLATLLSAVAQGLLAGFGFWVTSLFVPELEIVFALTLLTTVFALVPFVGAAAIWLPTSLWLLMTGHPYGALALAIYGAGVVSTADNVIKPLVLHGQSNLHPLLALLSVLGGVQLLGPIGILVGPMVVVFLQTLLNLLHRELSAMEERANSEQQQKQLPFILSLRQRRLPLTYATPNRNRRNL